MCTWKWSLILNLFQGLAPLPVAAAHSLRYPLVPLTSLNAPSPYIVFAPRPPENSAWGNTFGAFDHQAQVDETKSPLQQYSSPTGDYPNDGSGWATLNAPVSTSNNLDTLQSVSCRGDYIQIYLGASIQLAGHSFYYRAEANGGGAPSDFVISGSNDQTAWYVVDQRSGISGYGPQYMNFAIPLSKSATTYSSFRACISKITGAGANGNIAGHLNVGEWRLIAACPVGWFCDSSFVAVRPCLPGHFCNQNNVFANSIEWSCPAGTHNPVSGMSNISSCLSSPPCSAGSYCPAGSSSPTQASCGAGQFCGVTGLSGYFCASGAAFTVRGAMDGQGMGNFVASS